MKPTTPICDYHRLEAFFRGDLSAVEENDLALHLSDCEACRERLEADAAEPACWSKAGELLQPNEFTNEGADEGAAARSPQRSLHIQHVLDALAPTDDPEMLGRLGGYEVSGVIGAGGMGVVLKAFDKSLDRTVAIKVMAPHLASSGAARKRFAREASAAAAVLHPNVMVIHSVSNEESLPHLVMPYLRGQSLQKRIDDEGPPPVAEILRIASQTAAGLAAAHAQGLVHRDIKPANLLLEDGVERVAITDFGLARAVDDATMTRSGVIAGTPQFMSPEQARGDAVDQRSDLFSLGSVMYAMCTGRPPFRAETSYGILRRITDNEPRPIREINSEIPEWLCAIVSKLMTKQAEDRFDSAEQVAELLEDCLAHLQSPTTISLSAELKSLTAHRPSLPFQVLAGVLVMCCLSFAFLLVSQVPTPPATPTDPAAGVGPGLSGFAVQSVETARRPRAVDRRNARSVVEAYVALALGGKVARAAALAKDSPASPRRIAELPEFLNVQRLEIKTVYVNAPGKPTQALATSEAVRLDEKHKQPDGQRDGFLVFTLEVTGGRWSVTDVDFESREGADEELKRFLKANPDSISLPPRVIASVREEVTDTLGHGKAGEAGFPRDEVLQELHDLLAEKTRLNVKLRYVQQFLEGGKLFSESDSSQHAKSRREQKGIETRQQEIADRLRRIHENELGGLRKVAENAVLECSEEPLYGQSSYGVVVYAKTLAPIQKDELLLFHAGALYRSQGTVRPLQTNGQGFFLRPETGVPAGARIALSCIQDAAEERENVKNGYMPDSDRARNPSRAYRANVFDRQQGNS